MRVFPKAKLEWLEFMLFPFEAYPVLAFLAVLVGNTALPPRTNFDDVAGLLAVGCFVSFAVLLVAYLFYGFHGKLGSAASSLVFASVALIVGHELLPPLR